MEDFTRINNDTNGNPRYVIHFLNCMPDIEGWNNDTLSNKYGMTCRLMNKIGGRKYHNKSYGGGIVFQSYNLERTMRAIKEQIKEAERMHNNLPENRKYYKYESLLMDAACNEGYDDCTYFNNLRNHKECAQFIRGRFDSEYGWCIDQKGEMQALTDWLQGLALNIPYMNGDILELAGMQDASEKEQDKITKNYWKFMAMRLLGVFKYFDIERN